MYDLALLLTGAMLMLEGVWMLPLLLLDVFVAPAQQGSDRAGRFMQQNWMTRCCC
jgi:hypothetical protein